MDEIPLGHLNSSSFVELVVQQDVRPEQPDHEDVPQLSDEVWELAEKCWVKNPISRPTASAVCDIFSHLLNPPSVARRTPEIPTSMQEDPSQMLTPHILELKGHTSHIVCGTFSPDGKHIISGSNDRTIRIWDAQTGRPVLEPLKMHTERVTCVAFSPDSTQIASGGVDLTVLLWNAMTGQLVAKPFLGHTGEIYCVSFSPDGKRIVSGSSDMTIRIWNTQTGVNDVALIMGHTDRVNSAVFTKDGERIVSVSDDRTVRVWDINSRKLIHEPLTNHKYGVYFVGFSPNGETMISGGWDGSVCVWDLEAGTLLSGSSHQHTEGSLAVVFMPTSTFYSISPDGRWMAGNVDLESTGTPVKVWNSKTGLLAATFQTGDEYIHGVAFSPDSKCFLFCTTSAVYVHIIDW